MPRVMSGLVASHGRPAYTPTGPRSCRGGELLGGKKGLRTMPPTDEVIRLAHLQAIFYIVTGVWPFVSMRSFEAVTGPKVDRWLVKTVGALVAVIGCALAFGSRRQQLAPELVLVAAGSAAALV